MVLFSLLLPVTLCAAQQGETVVEVLHTTMPGFAASRVPGRTEEFSKIQTLRVAPNGRYIFTADYVTTTTRTVVVHNHAVLMEEDFEAPWDPGQVVSFIRGASVNDSGSVAIAVTTNTRRSSLVGLRNGTWQVLAEAGESVPGLVGEYGALYDPDVRQDDSVGFMTNDAIGFPSGQDELIFAGNQLLAQIGADTPSGQLGATQWPWENFDYEQAERGLRLAARTPAWMVTGRLANGEFVAVVNGDVVAQRNYPIPQSGISGVVSDFAWNSIDPDGHWWLTGRFLSGQEYFAVHDGNVVARTGEPIVPGSARTWSSASGFPFAVSQAGVQYLAGYSQRNGVDPAAVLVRNGSQVVLERSNRIDVDGDGDFDENVRFRRFFSEGAGVDDQGRLIAVIAIRQDGGTKTYQAIVRISVDGPRLETQGWVAGQQASIQLDDATPGDAAFAAISLTGRGPSEAWAPHGLVLVDLSPPWMRTTTVSVDAQGHATWQQGVPMQAQGWDLWVQAVTYSGIGWRSSNVRSATIQ